MEIKRDIYLNRIISYMWDGQVKVITGIRRCGKSYLLRNIFKRYLLDQGVAEDHILSYELDLAKDIQYRNPLELAKTADRAMVIGGGSIYRQLLPHCDTAYVTKVHTTVESDTFFPNLDDHPDWYLAETLQSGEENGISYEMLLYKRK